MALRESFTASGQAMGNSSMNLPETEVRASSGQDRNQSMVQPLMRPGNCCARRLNLTPTGLKHKQTCSLSLTRPRKKLYRLSHVSTVPAVHRHQGQLSTATQAAHLHVQESGPSGISTASAGSEQRLILKDPTSCIFSVFQLLISCQ